MITIEFKTLYLNHKEGTFKNDKEQEISYGSLNTLAINEAGQGEITTIKKQKDKNFPNELNTFKCGDLIEVSTTLPDSKGTIYLINAKLVSKSKLI